MIAAWLLLVVNDGPIEVRSRWLDPPPHFVNQAIGIEVTARNAGEGASIVPPRVIGGSLAPGPIEANSGGTLVATFRLTTTRAGPVQVPPFVAKEAGTDRVGRGGSLSTQVRELPASGRTRAFLGGIGTLDRVEAEAIPSSIRVGESFEYRLRIVGRAAPGTVQSPDLSGWGRLPLGLRIDPPRSEMVEDSAPPERILRARVRATVAGEAELPPIAVAAFDPKAQVYRTWRGPKVPIRVAEAPGFDPSAVNYGPPLGPPPRKGAHWPVIALVAAGIAGILAFGLGRILPRTRRDPRRLAGRAARSLAGIKDPSLLAGRIESALIAYLERAAGRPPGALTPSEAREWIGNLSGDPQRADQAHRVLESADRARYSGRREACDPLRDDAVALFRALALAGGPIRAEGKSLGDRRQD